MYQQTNASSAENLIDKIARFAVAAGWTQHKNTVGSGLRIVALRKGGDYIHIWNTSTSSISMRGSVGFTSGNPPTTQPNQSARIAVCNLNGAGPFSNVFMFADNTPAEHVHVVVEISGGIFRHFSFGLLDKTCAGAYTGGTYFDCVNWSTSNSFRYYATNGQNHALFGNQDANANCGSVRVDHGSLTNYFAPFLMANQTVVTVEPVASALVLSGGNQTSESYNYGDGSRYLNGYFYRSVNSWMGITPMKTIEVRIERPGAYFSKLGEAPNIRFINMSRFTPGEETTLGTSDVWKIFPLVNQRTGSNGDGIDASDQFAYAYKKVV